MTMDIRTAIRVLAPEVAAQIAAGEVVERPGSIVRELLDNAIDAGCRRLDVEIEEGGIGLIKVVDDGRGIAPADVEAAFERHATSKINDVSDLAHVHTLGFRGEALPSIAAAADVEVLTRVAEEPVGVLAVLVEGRFVRRQARGAPVGTAMTVRDLFARLPARRKFLGTPAGEARAVAALLAQYALAYPSIAMRLTNAGRVMIQTPGDGELRHAFAAIYGAETAGRMLPVDHRADSCGISGLVGPPEVTRGNRSGVSVFVNGRWVQSRPLVYAIVDAYHSQLAPGRYPLAALSLSLPDSEVDVNVHPAKAEVRFLDERAVGRAVRRAVTAALEESPPSWAGPWVEQGAQGSAAPSLRDRLAASAPTILLRPPSPLQGRFEVHPVRGGTFDSESPMRQTRRELLPLLRLVGQVAETYVVSEGPDGIYLLDQHAAHERVVFDRIRAGSTPSAQQPLLEPVPVELDLELDGVAAQHAEDLALLGVELQPFGVRNYLIRSVPPGLVPGDPAAAVRRLLADLATERRLPTPFERAAATVACHSSVRAGMALTMDEMRRLVDDLAETEQPRYCPHGRPTLAHLRTEIIERQFGRR